MELSSIFLASAPADRRAAFAAVPDLEVALEMLVASGRDAWPTIALKPAEFVAYLGCAVPVESAPDLGALCARDLFLACAYALGVPGAAAALDASSMERVEAALMRVGAPDAMRDDILQDLRERLVTPTPDRKGYSGRGALTSWLCVAAVREANRRGKRQKRELPLTPSAELLLGSAHEDPEMAYLHRTYKEQLNNAFRTAFAELPVRDRNILRHHLIDGLSIDHLGLLYGVHRATAARWINRACAALRLRTKEIFGQHISLSQEGFHQILHLIESQIGVELAAVSA